PAVDRVVSGPAEDRVVAAEAEDPVVAAEPADDIPARRAADGVVARRALPRAERLPVRRPVELPLAGQLADVGSVRFHAVKLQRTGAVAHEDDSVAAGRPGGLEIGPGVARQAPDVSAVRGHRVELEVLIGPVAREQDASAV